MQLVRINTANLIKMEDMDEQRHYGSIDGKEAVSNLPFPGSTTNRIGMVGHCPVGISSIAIAESCACIKDAKWQLISVVDNTSPPINDLSESYKELTASFQKSFMATCKLNLSLRRFFNLHGTNKKPLRTKQILKLLKTKLR